MLKQLNPSIKASNFSKILETALRTAKIGGTSQVEHTKGNIITTSVIPDGKALWRDVSGNLITGRKTDLQEVLEELTGRDIDEIVFKGLKGTGAVLNDIVFKG